MDDQLIDAICHKWRIETEQIDKYIAGNKWQLAMARGDEFIGWMSGFYAACGYAGAHEAAAIVGDAWSLFLYRRNIDMHRAWRK